MKLHLRLALVAALSIPATSFADNHEEPAADAAGIAVAQGKIAVNVGILLNLASDLVGKPFSINPDVTYGVMKGLDLGIYHTPVGITGFWDGAGGGLCLSGEDNGCAKVFDGTTGLLANYDLLSNGQVTLAANGGFTAASLDPFMLALKAGVTGTYNAGQVSVGFAPSVFIGLTERDAGNKEILFVPVSASFAATPQLNIGVQTGIRGPLDGFGDAWQLPISARVGMDVTDAIGVAATFGLNRVAGGVDGPGAGDARTAGVNVTWHN